MSFTPRTIAPALQRAARAFPALILTGPRRSGKTTLLRKLFAGATHVLLEDPDVVGRVRADPQGFLDDLRLPVILDEVQNVPEILSYVRTRIDRAPTRKGRWLMTGSQEAPLMRGVTESMAGRAAIFQLLPFSTRESPKVSLLRGGFPEPLARPRTASVWFRSYVQTYLERDVRAISSIRDLSTFRRFLALVASRIGQVLNKTDLAAPLGISVPTVTEWLSILEVTAQVLLVPPFFESFGKRLVKSPKLYLADSGLACHLLGIETERDLERSPFLGALFEGFVASELAKAQIGAGRARELYGFRDQQGLEVDFAVPGRAGAITLVEAKASRTVHARDGESLVRLARAVKGRDTRCFVVHRPPRQGGGVSSLRPGVRAVTIAGLVDALFPSGPQGAPRGR